MGGQTLRTVVSVALWSAVTSVGMLVTGVPAGIAAGLGQWWILRSRLNLGRGSAIPFALSFPVGQFPSYVMYLAAYSSGLGGVDGPPQWFLAVALASGGLLAGICQFLGLPKSWSNFRIWIPATCLAWAVTALDLNIRGLPVLTAVLSGLTTGLAMLALSSWPQDAPQRKADQGRVRGRPAAAAKAAAGSGRTGGRR
jgi:hypothetical protein